MRRRATWIAGLAAAVALSGCAAGTAPGGGQGSPAGPSGLEARALSVFGRVGRVLGGVGSDRGEAPAPEAATGFAAQDIVADPGAFRLVQINALGLQEPARAIRANGAEITYELQSGPTAAFDDGVLVATRGFGDDLLAIDSRGVRDALRAGGGTLTRRMERLDSQDQVSVSSFACTIAPAGAETVDLGLRQVEGRRFDESCRSEALIFDNIYWLDPSGEILSSRQFVSPGVAYLRSNRL